MALRSTDHGYDYAHVYAYVITIRLDVQIPNVTSHILHLSSAIKLRTFSRPRYRPRPRVDRDGVAKPQGVLMEVLIWRTASQLSVPKLVSVQPRFPLLSSHPVFRFNIKLLKNNDLIT